MSRSILALIFEERKSTAEIKLMEWEDFCSFQSLQEEKILQQKDHLKKKIELEKLSESCTLLEKWNKALHCNFGYYVDEFLHKCCPNEKLYYLHSPVVDETSLLYSLHKTCQCGNSFLTNILLRHGATPHQLDREGNTPLHYATDVANLECVQALLKADASIVQFQNNKGMGCIHLAAKRGCAKIIKLLLETDKVVQNTKTNENWTAVHFAAKYGHKDCLSILLEAGADVNAKTTSGDNLLHLLLQQKFMERELILVISPFLKESSLLLKDKNQDGYNALHLAIQSNYNLASHLFLQHGASPNECTTLGMAPLHMAVLHHNMDIFQALMHFHINLDLPNQDGLTPMCLACQANNQPAILHLIASGASLNYQNHQGMAPLHFLAAYCRSEELIAHCIESGANVHQHTKKKNTPLHFAAMNGNRNAFNVLVSHGGDLNALNNDGHGVLSLARKWGHYDLAECILKGEFSAINSSNIHKEIPSKSEGEKTILPSCTLPQQVFTTISTTKPTLSTTKSTIPAFLSSSSLSSMISRTTTVSSEIQIKKDPILRRETLLKKEKVLPQVKLSNHKTEHDPNTK